MRLGSFAEAVTCFLVDLATLPRASERFAQGQQYYPMDLPLALPHPAFAALVASGLNVAPTDWTEAQQEVVHTPAQKLVQHLFLQLDWLSLPTKVNFGLWR